MNLIKEASKSNWVVMSALTKLEKNEVWLLLRSKVRFGKILLLKRTA